MRRRRGQPGPRRVPRSEPPPVRAAYRFHLPEQRLRAARPLMAELCPPLTPLQWESSAGDGSDRPHSCPTLRGAS
jgi:hypothetical protein